MAARRHTPGVKRERSQPNEMGPASCRIPQKPQEREHHREGITCEHTHTVLYVCCLVRVGVPRPYRGSNSVPRRWQ